LFLSAANTVRLLPTLILKYLDAAKAAYTICNHIFTLWFYSPLKKITNKIESCVCTQLQLWC